MQKCLSTVEAVVIKTGAADEVFALGRRYRQEGGALRRVREGGNVDVRPLEPFVALGTSSIHDHGGESMSSCWNDMH